MVNIYCYLWLIIGYFTQDHQCDVKHAVSGNKVKILILITELKQWATFRLWRAMMGPRSHYVNREAFSDYTPNITGFEEGLLFIFRSNFCATQGKSMCLFALGDG